MSYRVDIHPEAAEEIVAARNYIAQDAPTGAERWEEGLQRAILSLVDFPLRGAAAPESNYSADPIRQLVYGSYRVLYIIDPAQERVVVVHVRHGARRAIGEREEP